MFSGVTLSQYNDSNKAGAEREGPLAFDVDCKAVHAVMSPWRYYLDVERDNRAMRIARMWLNA